MNTLFYTLEVCLYIQDILVKEMSCILDKFIGFMYTILRKSRKPFHDFLLGGAADGRLVFSFENSG